MISRIIIPLSCVAVLCACDPSAAPPDSAADPAPAAAVTPAVTAAVTPAVTAATTPGNDAATSIGARTSLPNGLSYTVTKPGAGPKPRLGSQISFHWTGEIEGGNQFWDTRAAGVPQSERLDYDQLITGLVDSLLQMRTGERRELHIPSKLAWGTRGYQFVVLPNRDVVIDVELVSVDS